MRGGFRGTWVAWLVVLSGLWAGPAPAAAQTTAAQAEGTRPAPEAAAGERELRVGVAGSAPFVVTGKGGPDGLSVEVWKAAAAQAGLRYRLIPLGGVAQALAEVAAGRIDVAVGPLSITADRAEKVAFTQPYYESSLAILAGSGTLWQRIAPFMSRAFLVGVGVLLFVLLIVGVLLWLAERRRNPGQFPDRFLAGTANGIWLALVTFTTVGYGDRAPVTTAGRAIAGAWMVISMITASSLTAGIATAFTLSQIGRAEVASAADLSRRRVAVVAGTTGEAFARAHGARLVVVPTLDDAVAKLRSDAADAVVFDRPMLRYWLRQHPDVDLGLAAARYDPQGYGFALPLGSPFQARLTVALLKLQQSGRIETIAGKWLGP